MGKKHVLVLPFVLQSHFFSMFGQALALAKRGVTVTFLGLGEHIALLKTSDELRGLDFNTISYQDFGSEHYFQRTPGDLLSDVLEFIESSSKCFQPILDKLLADKRAGLPGPTCIIGDWLLTWALDAAKQLNIPYYQYYSCAAINIRELQARPLLFDDGTLTMTKGPGGDILAEFEGFLKIPGLPALQYRDMSQPPLMDAKGVIYSNDEKIAVAMRETDGLIANTNYELEAPQVDALVQSWKEDSQEKIPKLLLVGPVRILATLQNRSLTPDLKDRAADCLRWLDRRLPRSVVYICIGSLAHFSPKQIEELALALEASEQGFLWVASRGGTALPPNFEERTRKKGLTVSGWVPQVQILEHPALGGFVTHCGWNSIIESITAGVPMAAWPQLACDQVLNARYIVDGLKIAVDVRRENPYFSVSGKARMPTSAVPDHCVSLETAVRLLVSEEGNALRSRVQELKKKMEAAVADGGARDIAMNELVSSIPP